MSNQTIATPSQKKAAVAAFNTHKGLKEVHVTSDGETFFTTHDANNHGKTLPKPGYASILRGEVDLKEKANKEESKPGKEEGAE
ncbi:MAG: hypothetical protein MH137_11165 [Flavobacteriales bacterium]|nr:hypothetical protein [Flavobacteriales bacterium]